MRYIFIINPKSGQRALQRSVTKVMERLKEEGHQVEAFQTVLEGDAERFAASLDLCEAIDLLVAVGGDGTVNEVINGIYDNKQCYPTQDLPPIAIVPAGTVNDFANHFRLPSKEAGLYQYFTEFYPTQVDIGDVNGRYFTNVVAAGYISDVGYRVQRRHKKRFGRLAYYVEGVYEALKYLKQSNRFSFTIGEHQVTLDAYMFIALNTTHLGGLSYFAPTASSGDGFLDLFIIKKTGLVGGFLLLIKILLGKHIDDRNVIYFKVKSFQVDANRSLDVDVDGERGCTLPLKVSVHRQKLTIALPMGQGQGR